MATLRGTLTNIRYQGRGHWSVATLRTTDGEVTCTGPLVAVQEGDSLELSGGEGWTDAPKFGKQYQFKRAQVVVASDSDGVVAYLTSLPDIGYSRAMEIVERFGAQGVWPVLEDHPEKLLAISGITQARARSIRESYLARKEQREQLVFLKRWGLTDYQCSLVLERYGDECEAVISENPYQLMDLDGMGFLTVDKISRRCGVRRDSLERACAGVLHMMGVAQQMGHVYVPLGRLRSRCLKDLAVPADRAGEAVGQLEGEGKLVVEGPPDFAGPSRVYLRGLHESELTIVARLVELAPRSNEEAA